MSEALILEAADKWVEKVIPFAHHGALKDMIRAVFRAHYKTPSERWTYIVWDHKEPGHV